MTQPPKKNRRKLKVKDLPKASRKVVRDQKESARKAAELLSECTLKYAVAVKDGFHPLAMGACVPDTQTTKSFKFTSRQSGALSTGVNGNGGLVYAPLAACNDLSTSAMTGATSVLAPGAALTTATFQSNGTDRCVFSSTQWDDQLTFRHVATTMRLKYTGPALYKGGLVYAYTVPPGNETAAAFSMTEAEIALSRNTQLVVLNDADGWITVNYSAIEHEAGLSGIRTSSDVTNRLGFYITTTSNAAGIGPASFIYEIITHYEAYGEVNGASDSHSDAAGYAAVKQIAHNNSINGPGPYLPGSLSNFISRVGVNVLKQSGNMALEAVKRHWMSGSAGRLLLKNGPY